MSRLHLFEIQDHPWCPRRWRDCMTELMRWSVERLRIYDAVLPQLQRLLAHANSHKIVDLCAGGAGPWRRLAPALSSLSGAPVQILLTDKYPNHASMQQARDASAHQIDFIAASVDATQVPASLQGARTLFSSFHHFRPDVARAVLRDAALSGTPIGVFEFTERSAFACVGMLFAPLVALLVVPFLRPFSIWRLLSCWPLPFVPLIATWDGLVSNLRSYSVDELQSLVADIKLPNYHWEIGRTTASAQRLAVTYLLGLPRRA
jgi:hypothetical protein